MTIVLDNIRSLHNVGSVFRTADAFAVEQVLLCGVTAKPPHREIRKTALGATESVDWQYFESAESAVRELKNNGYRIYSIEQVEEPVYLYELETPKEKLAIVLGNEVDGVDNEVIGLSDACVEIPQFGTKHSLNVSVTCGIVLWQLLGRSQ